MCTMAQNTLGVPKHYRWSLSQTHKGIFANMYDIQIKMNIHVYTYIGIYIYIHIQMYLYVYIFVYTYIYVCAYVYIYTCINIYMCTYVYIYMHIHVYRNTRERRNCPATFQSLELK